MADFVILQRKLYVGGRDLSGDHTAIELLAGRDAIEFTKGQDTTHLFKSGLRNVSLAAEGVVNLGTDLEDDELFNSADSLTDQPIIVSCTTGLDGEPAYGFRANVGRYAPFSGANVGERLNFSVEAMAYASKCVRGKIIVDASAAKTATFNGTGRELTGGVSATQKLYACVMVLAASGTTPTLDGVIQSDSASNFPSPTSVITFTQKTTTGQYEWAELSGAIADAHYRFVGTIGGTTPSFTIVVFLARA